MAKIEMTVLAEEYPLIESHNLTYEIVAEVGPEGGNPWVIVRGDRRDIAAFLLLHCPDDAAFLRSRIVAE